MPGRLLAIAVLAALFALPASLLSQTTPPSTYFAIRSRTVYPKPAVPIVGPAGHRFTDPTFGSRLARITDGNTRPGVLNRSYSTPSAAHQLAWNATSDRFYVRSLDGWFIPYDFNPTTMTASRIEPTSTGNGGLLIQSHVEPQFSFISRDVIYAATPNIAPNGGWALFTSNWEKTLGLASSSEPEGLYRTDVFLVRLTPSLFTDAPLVAGGVIKAVHFTELRERIDIARAMHGLAPYVWTDSVLVPGTTIIKAAHVTDLQTALQQAFAAAGRAVPTFQSITARATLIGGDHLEELRDALVSLESS